MSMNWISRLFGLGSSKKHIYFVRHGETVLNAKQIRQGSEGPLSEKGRKQAAQTGERLASFKFDIVLVSPFQRTRETADIINTYLHNKLEYVDLLVERRNPKEIIGKWAGDPEVRNIVDRIDKSFHDDNLRFSDEENFSDLKKRAAKLLMYLSQRPEKNILCVTHGIFLAMIMAYANYGESLTPEMYIKMSFFDPAKNAGISVCEYDPHHRKRESGWRVLAWNDYSRHAK
jgi:broad specificity phosphatase PhoE